ncbi:MAG: hypothetical protein RL582_366 [Bacteroidota bacterium]|jgi:hypothetical protein
MLTRIPLRTPLSILFFVAFSSVQLFAQTSLRIKIKGVNTYAGIEVGSKGVKMSVIEVTGSGLKNGNFKILKDTSVNTDFITFSKESFRNTLLGLTGLYETANKQYQIPENRIFVVFSSGVKAVADRENKVSMIGNMADSFRLAINEPNRKVEPIDVIDEARLSHLGIVPSSKRYTTFLIDIGSGNTKGGYFPSGNTKDFSLFQLTWGTKSISNATEKRLDDDKTLVNFSRQMQRVLAGPAEEEITYAVNVSNAYNMSDNIAFSGGIAWAASTLIYPELAENPVVPVIYDDVVKLSEKIYKNYLSVSDSAIVKGLSDPSLDKKMIGNEIRKVNKVFDQRALMSGIGLLLKIMRQFEGVHEKKQFYFVKNGQVGWISAYVSQAIAEQK